MKFTIGEKTTAAAQRAAPAPGEVARGPGWRVIEEGAGLALHYQSAQQGEGERTVAIGADDLSALRADPDALDAILRARGQ